MADISLRLHRLKACATKPSQVFIQRTSGYGEDKINPLFIQ